MFNLRVVFTVAILTGITLTMAMADTLYHKNGQVVNGSIINETASHITIQTDDYGRLRFERKAVDRLIRGGVEVSPNDLSRVSAEPEATPASAASARSNPFGPASAATSSANPFSGTTGTSSATTNPFSQTDPPASETVGNPFSEITSAPEPASASPFTAPEFVNTSPFSVPSPSGPIPSTTDTPSPFSDIGGAAPPSPADSVIDLPPAFQLANSGPGASARSMTDGGNPLSLDDMPEPLIINSGQALQPERITRARNIPTEVPAGHVAVIYSAMSDVRAHTSDNGWEFPEGHLPLPSGSDVWAASGKAKMLLKNKSTVLVPPNTFLKVQNSDESPSGMEVDLKSGRIWVHVPPTATDGVFVDAPDLKATLMPGLYAVGAETGQYTRLAVFEGRAEGVNQSSKQPFTVSGNQTIQGCGQTGIMCPPRESSSLERREFDEWDMWAFEVHNEVAQQHMFQGADPALLNANDKRNGSSDSGVSVDESRITAIKQAFLQFCIDTGRAPSTQEGYNALLTNPGLSNWRGPYYKGPVPPVDSWGMPIRYTLKRDPATGELIGEILSAGPNRIYSEGRNDDLKAVVPFYRYMR